MSQKKRKIGIDDVSNELAKIQERTNATLHTLQDRITTLEKRIDKIHRNRWRYLSLAVNVLTITALIGGAWFQIWLNRPVVDFQLFAPPDSAYPAVGPRPVLIYFEAQNTGQTDITLNVTLVGINCTVSTVDSGPFSQNTTASRFYSG